jgi:hypothetical protein
VDRPLPDGKFTCHRSVIGGVLQPRGGPSVYHDWECEKRADVSNTEHTLRTSSRIMVARIFVCVFALASVVISFDYIFKYRNAESFLASNLKPGEYRFVMWKPFLVEMQIGDPDKYNCTYTYAEFFGMYRLIEKVSEHPEPSR